MDRSATDLREPPIDAFSRPFALERLHQRKETPVDLSATDAERRAICAAYELTSLEGFRLAGAFAPWRRDGWRFEGRLEATCAQACVVTLEPVAQEIVEPIVRIWSPSAGEAALDIDPSAEDEETPEPPVDPIDLGAVALEAFSLALEPYPRAPDAALGPTVIGPPDVEPLTDEASKPFAGLAALRSRLDPAEDADAGADASTEAPSLKRAQ